MNLYVTTGYSGVLHGHKSIGNTTIRAIMYGVMKRHSCVNFRWISCSFQQIFSKRFSRVLSFQMRLSRFALRFAEVCQASTAVVPSAVLTTNINFSFFIYVN